MLALALALVVNQVPDRLQLEVGESRTVHVPHLQRITIGGSGSMLEVRPGANDTLVLVGRAEGQTTVPVWCADGKRYTILVTITPARPRRAPSKLAPSLDAAAPQDSSP